LTADKALSAPVSDAKRHTAVDDFIHEIKSISRAFAKERREYKKEKE
jgi:hypothetical protein